MERKLGLSQVCPRAGPEDIPFTRTVAAAISPDLGLLQHLVQVVGALAAHNLDFTGLSDHFCVGGKLQKTRH